MKLRSVMSVIVPMLLIAGCTGPRHEELVNFLTAHEQIVSGSNYRFAPPDRAVIRAPKIPEVDGASQITRPDGKISLRLLGDVKVAGLTPLEVEAKLEKLLSRYYVKPRVRVTVGNAGTKQFYVFGEVGSPGPRKYTGRDTLLEVLAQSQPTFRAWKDQVKIIRPSPDKEERYAITINVDKLMQQGDTRYNFLLEEGDIVYVPPTPLAWLGYRIREVLDPFQPVLQAYETPAEFLDANDEYEDRNDDDD